MKIGFSLGPGRGGSGRADAALPALQTTPGLSGTPVVGEILTAVPGTWNGADTIVGQWLRGGADIPGATGGVYQLTPEDDLAQISYRETATNAAGAAVAASPAVLALYEAPSATAGALDEIFDQDTGVQLIDASVEFAGEGLTFSAAGTGVSIDPLTGVLSVDTTDPVSDETVTVVAANSGGSAQKQFILTVEGGEETSDQVLNFDGSSGLRQPFPGFSFGGVGPTLDAEGFWMAAYVYYGGGGWAGGTLFSFSDASSATKRLSMTTRGALTRNDTAIQTDAPPDPTVPGWYLVVSRISFSGSANRADIRFWRNDDYAQKLNQLSNSDLSAYDTIGVGEDQHSAFKNPYPSHSFAWGYGDPAAMHAWVYNSGDFRDLADYNFEGDPNATLEMYVAGHRVNDATAFDVSQVPDTEGSLSGSWTNIGSLGWVDRAPAYAAEPTLLIQSITVDDINRDQVTISATAPGATLDGNPVIAIAEDDFDLWTERGFGPIRIQSAIAAVAGDQATITLTLNREIYASEVVQYSAVAGWYDGGAHQGGVEVGALANNSTLADPALSTGLSFGRIAVAFDAPYAAGFYEDDLGYVVDPGSGVQIVDTYPTARKIPFGAGDADGHGAQKNPMRETYIHGYDGRNVGSVTKYTASLNDALSLPVSLTQFDSFVKVRSNLNHRSENGGTAFHPVYLKQAWGLYVASSAPAPNEFCPPLVNYDGTSARPSMVLDAANVAANLPSYPFGAIARPPIEEVAARANRFNPCAVQLRSVEDRRHMTVGGITNEDGYGLKYAEMLNAAGICLIGDDPAASKEDLVRGLASWGHQWDGGIVLQGGSIFADGGQNQYHPFPIILSRAWSGASAADVGAVADLIPANLFGQTAELDASLVAAVMNPHGTAGEALPKSPNDNLPYASHRKLVSAVNGNVVTMATAREAEIGGSSSTNPKISHVGMRLRRESDGLTALITAENAANRTYTLDDATGFATSDSVYVIPPYDAAVGDFEWSVIGFPNNANSFGPDTSYRSLNGWSGMVMCIRALGLMHANFEAWEGYVARANEQGNPTGPSDYPAHHTQYRRGPKEPSSPLFFNLDRDFWNVHWAAISTTPSII